MGFAHHRYTGSATTTTRPPLQPTVGRRIVKTIYHNITCKLTNNLKAGQKDRPDCQSTLTSAVIGRWSAGRVRRRSSGRRSPASPVDPARCRSCRCCSPLRSPHLHNLCKSTGCSQLNGMASVSICTKYSYCGGGDSGNKHDNKYNISHACTPASVWYGILEFNVPLDTV